MFAHELKKDPDLWRQFGKAVQSHARRLAAERPRHVAQAVDEEQALAVMPEPEPERKAWPRGKKAATPPAASADVATESPANQPPPAAPRAQGSSIHTFQASGLSGMRPGDAAAAVWGSAMRSVVPQAPISPPLSAEGNVRTFVRATMPAYGPPPPVPLEWLKQHPDFPRMGVRGSFRCSSCHKPGDG